MDHIDGNGLRKVGMQGGKQFYYWLKKQGYPPGFQVLCMNCQWIKRAENDECSTSGPRREKSS
jgi:hypothetical protein